MRSLKIALTVLGLAAASAKAAPSSTFTFEDLTDDGFGLKFSNDASASFPIVNVNGSNYMQVARTGAFQEADNGTGNTSTAFYQAMNAAAANPAGYDVSYDWYVDTSTASGSTFLQLGTYVNGGSGAYAQDFGAVKEVELSGTQLASGQVFSGHVDVNMAAAGLILSPTETFYRLGFIENGNGTVAVDFDNISVHPVAVPEPASLALIALVAPALATRRRRA